MVIYSEFKIDIKNLRCKQAIKAAKMYVKHNRKVFNGNYLYPKLRFYVSDFDKGKFAKSLYHTILV